MVTINKVLRGLTPLTARSIKQFIGSKEAEEALGWFIGKQLDKVFDDETNLFLLQENLKSIHKEFEDIKVFTPMKKKESTEFEHLQTRILQAEMDICHKFHILQTILANKESKDKRDIEINWLRLGILDSNNGVLSNLSVIHQELVGQTVDPTKKSLLAIWYNGVCNYMNETPVSAKTGYDILMKLLTKAAILQLKGFLLFKGANENSQFCSAHLKNLENNLKSQSHLMETQISSTMKYLADPSQNNTFYLRPVSGVGFEPFIKRRGEKKTLIYEYHLEYIVEEMWLFEKSPTFDNDGSLLISGNSIRKDGKRSYLSVNDGNKAIVVSKKADAQPFFVMPLDEESSTQITICQPKSKLFLGNNLKFTEKIDTIKFTMTKPKDTSEAEHKWDMFSILRNLWSKITTLSKRHPKK